MHGDRQSQCLGPFDALLRDREYVSQGPAQRRERNLRVQRLERAQQALHSLVEHRVLVNVKTTACGSGGNLHEFCDDLVAERLGSVGQVEKRQVDMFAETQQAEIIIGVVGLAVVDQFYRRVNDLILDQSLNISSIRCSDDNLQSVFDYLVH